MERVLVTGGCGFIGSHLVEALLSSGCFVTVFDICRWDDPNNCLKFMFRKRPAKLHFIRGNIRKPGDIKNATYRGVQVVFHLAAEISIPYSYHFPQEVKRTNIDGTLNALMAARNAGINRFIHTSSSEVYGSAMNVPMDENHQLHGQSPYAASKIGADKLAESFYRSYDLPVTTIRPFNVFGPRQSERAIIPNIIRQLIGGETLSLGNTYPTRDFTFVTDTVRAFILAAEKDETIGREINIGSGKEISVATLAERIGGMMGVTINESHCQDRIRPTASEVDRLCSDSSLAKELIGWSPCVCLEDGLKETIKWFRAHPDFHGNDRG